MLWLLTRGSEQERARSEERLREEGFDAILDDPRTLNALLAQGGFSTASEPLVFYVLVRHALLEGNISDRVIADYLAALLINFGHGRRAYRISEDELPEYFYLVDLQDAAENAILAIASFCCVPIGRVRVVAERSVSRSHRGACAAARRTGPGFLRGARGTRLSWRSRSPGRGAQRTGRECIARVPRPSRRCGLRRTALPTGTCSPQRGDSISGPLRQINDTDWN